MLQSHTVQVCPSTNYERHLVLQAFQRLGVLVVDENTDSSDPALALMWAKPRDINWTRALDGSLVVSSYMLHSALTRKADLARCLQRRQRKHQQSHAALSMPLTYIIDADDCESDAGSIPGDLQAAWSAVEREGGLWLLKSSDSNRGENIFVIEPTASGRQQVEQSIGKAGGMWVLQRYVEDLLLLEGRKCHLRVHALATGDLRVHLHGNTLVLPAAQLFNTDAGQLDNKLVHATNYAVQARHGGGRCTAPSMLLSEACALWSTDAELQHTAEALESHITQQLEEIVRDTFEAAKAYPPGFFPLANCFQLFGFDFMLDRSLRLHLLEVNCDPSLSIFGDHHRPACQQLLDDMAVLACGLLDSQACSSTDPAACGTAAAPSAPTATLACSSLDSRACSAAAAHSVHVSCQAVSGVCEQAGYRLILDSPPRYEAAAGRAVLSRLMTNMGALTAATYDWPRIQSRPSTPSDHTAQAATEASMPQGSPSAVLSAAAACAGQSARIAPTSTNADFRASMAGCHSDAASTLQAAASAAGYSRPGTAASSQASTRLPLHQQPFEQQPKAQVASEEALQRPSSRPQEVECQQGAEMHRQRSAAYAGDSAERPRKCCIAPGFPHAAAVEQLLHECGWEVTRDSREPLCDLQLADYEDVRWDKVLDGSLTSNHYYNRRCLLGSPARLAQLYLLIQRQQQQPASTAVPHSSSGRSRTLQVQHPAASAVIDSSGSTSRGCCQSHTDNSDDRASLQQPAAAIATVSLSGEAAAGPVAAAPEAVWANANNENSSFAFAQTASSNRVSQGGVPEQQCTSHVRQRLSAGNAWPADESPAEQSSQHDPGQHSENGHVLRMPCTFTVSSASLQQPGRVAELARVLHGKSWRMTPLASPGSSRPLEHTVLPGKEVLDALQRQTRAGADSPPGYLLQQCMPQPLLAEGRAVEVTAFALAVGNLHIFMYGSLLVNHMAPSCTETGPAHPVSFDLPAAEVSTAAMQSTLDSTLEQPISQALSSTVSHRSLQQSVAAVFSVAKRSATGFLPFTNCFELFSIRLGLDMHGQTWLLGVQPLSSSELGSTKASEGSLVVTMHGAAEENAKKRQSVNKLMGDVVRDSLVTALPLLGLGSVRNSSAFRSTDFRTV